MITEPDLDEIFKYHPPDAEQLVQYEAIREGAKTFAKIILANSPPSADQTTAVRRVRETVMIANAAIALHGRY